MFPRESRTLRDVELRRLEVAALHEQRPAARTGGLLRDDRAGKPSRDDAPCRLGACRMAGDGRDERLAIEREQAEGRDRPDGGRPGDVAEESDLAEELARVELLANA
jgi:hypothetical protein